eukprot:11181635-Lingulodinium_polyedra.AAC.1
MIASQFCDMGLRFEPSRAPGAVLQQSIVTFASRADNANANANANGEAGANARANDYGCSTP